MIRLPLTSIFLSMDEVKEYETRHTFRQSPKVRGSNSKVGQVYNPDDAAANDAETGSQVQLAAPRSTRPKTPEQRQPAARNSLVIRSTSQPPAMPTDPGLTFAILTDSYSRLAPDTSADIEQSAGHDGDLGNASIHHVDQSDGLGDGSDGAEKGISISSHQRESPSGYNTRQRRYSDSPQSARWLAMPPQRASPGWRDARLHRPQTAPIDESS